MCLTCGCKKPEKSHGDRRNLTIDDLQGAAAAAGISTTEAAENLLSTTLHAVKVLKAVSADRFLLMVGYSPNRMPKRGADGFRDIASPRLVEKACWRFALNGFRAGLHHQPGAEDAFKVVENYVYRNPVPWVVKAADGSEQTIREGDWVFGIICSKETWERYEAGELGSASMQGGCNRGPVSAETLARQRSA